MRNRIRLAVAALATIGVVWSALHDREFVRVARASAERKDTPEKSARPTGDRQAGPVESGEGAAIRRDLAKESPTGWLVTFHCVAFRTEKPVESAEFVALEGTLSRRDGNRWWVEPRADRPYLSLLVRAPGYVEANVKVYSLPKLVSASEVSSIIRVALIPDDGASLSLRVESDDGMPFRGDVSGWATGTLDREIQFSVPLRSVGHGLYRAGLPLGPWRVRWQIGSHFNSPQFSVIEGRRNENVEHKLTFARGGDVTIAFGDLRTYGVNNSHGSVRLKSSKPLGLVTIRDLRRGAHTILSGNRLLTFALGRNEPRRFDFARDSRVRVDADGNPLPKGASPSELVRFAK